jgi:hypothetical protein
LKIRTRGLSSVDQDDGCDQVDRREIVSRQFIVARRNATEVLNLVKETLDEISLAIECKITFMLVLAVGLGRNDRGRPLLREFVDEGIGP